MTPPVKERRKRRTPEQVRRDRWERLNAKVPELMGANQLARLLGVSSSNLNAVRDLPPHAQEPERGRLWRVDVIEEYLKGRDG